MLLDSCQLSMLEEFDRSDSIKYVILSSRRLGKSYALSTHAIETAIQRPNRYIKYLTSTSKAAKEIVLPLFNMILTSCPTEYRPQYFVHDSKWVFPNGSEILLHGTDKDKGEGLRGQSADLAIIDEAGFVDGLDYLASDILLPMIIERGGRMLLSSTPPRESSHPLLSFIAEAERKKAITIRILTDCPRFTKKQIESFIDEAGGMESDTCKREYFCQVIRDTSMAIVPEFDDIMAKRLMYAEAAPLDYLPDCYVSMDPGFADNAAILYAYWDFPKACLMVQAEYVAAGNSTQEIAKEIKDTERRLWQVRAPYKRVSDTDLRLIKDLKDMHGLRFVKTEKDNKEAQINALRILIKNKQIMIHESCTQLISQLKYGQFKVSGSGNRDFRRTAEMGHCDAIDALLYLIRNINKTRNPIPEEGFNQFYQVDYWREETKLSGNAKKLSKAFKRR